MRYRSRAHKKPDPLAGYTDHMQRALKILAQFGVSVPSRSSYVPAGAPNIRIGASVIAALNRRDCISWIAQGDRNDATLSTKGRTLAFLVMRRNAEAAGIRPKLQARG